MKKRPMFLTILALALLVAVTPVLASGSGSQNRHQNQDHEQNQDQNQNQEQNQGQNQNQEHNQDQSQNQEKSQHRHGEGNGGQPSPLPRTQLFTLTGTITVLSADSITASVHNGNRFVKPYIGQELVVLVTGDTAYRAYRPSGCVPIGFEDPEVGDSVSIKGTVSEGAFTALRVTIDVPCCTP